MKTYKPIFKEKDLALYESINNQFKNSFPEPLKGNPKKAIETCDLHLDLKQTLRFVDPKGNPANEVTWDEPKDLALYWQSKNNILWALVGGCSLIFALILYYSGWIKFV